MTKTQIPRSDWRLYLRLLAYLRPYRRALLLAVLCMVLLGLTAPAVAAILKPMLDGMFIAHDPQWLVGIPVLLLLLFMVRAASAFGAEYLLLAAAGGLVSDLRERMFERLLTLPSAYFDSHTTGGIISRFTFDVTQVREACTSALTVIVRDGLATAGLLAWMWWLNWKLSLVAAVTAPVIVVVVYALRERLRGMSRRVQASMAAMHHALGEVIGGERIVKLFGARTQEAERFHTVVDRHRSDMTRFAAAAAAGGPALELITAVALAGTVAVAGVQIRQGHLTPGEFVSFFGAAVILIGPLKRLVRVNEFLQRGLSAAESVFTLLDEPAERDDGRTHVKVARGEIEIRDVTFSHAGDGAPALARVDLHIHPGETVAIAGASGSGKTTLAGLIARFYEPAAGQIRIDGHDIKQIPLADLRAAIALVSQDIVLFEDSVRNNIAYGACRGASDDAVRAAAEAAHAMTFISELPKGFDTCIGERGARLSGGQRQRIAIARALLKNAPILILDEATSSVDPESERQINDALEHLRAGRTCLLIAHRATTLRSADRIVVLENGRFVEAGTHEELLVADGAYARLQRTG